MAYHSKNPLPNVYARPPAEVPGEVHDFGTKDSRGRAVGSLVYRYEADLCQYQEVQPNPSFLWSGPVSLGRRVFCYFPHATRDGKPFGAIQEVQIYDSEEAREDGVKKYLEGARKRAATKAAT